MKRVVLTLFLLTFSTSVWASGGEEIPYGLIFKQLFNLALLIVLLYFLLKNKVKEHFKGKHQSYNEFLVRAEKAKMEAENSHKEILKKINELEENKQATIKKAHSEAADLKRRTLEEARKLSEKLEHDARVTTENEIERAKEALREEMLERAVESARKALSENVKTEDLQRLQTQFVEKIQVVK